MLEPKKETKTEKINISEDPAQEPQQTQEPQPINETPETNFNINVPIAQQPGESEEKSEIFKNMKEKVERGIRGPGLKKFKEQIAQKHKAKLGMKIWNFLEWIAMSALIFVIFFFIINFSAYSTLIKSKLQNMTGNFEINPYIEQMLKPDEPEDTTSQTPLPLTETQSQSVQQIPNVDISVAPPDERIIIPRINKNIPIVKVSTENLIKRDWGALENEIQEALRDGVVHYPGTAEPSESGNVVITGHSSYFPWDPGRFKDVFALLHEVAVGDTIIVYYNQQKYSYEVYETRVVTPDKVDVLTQAGENRLTLITCTPVGTNLKRLVVLAKPIN